MKIRLVDMGVKPKEKTEVYPSDVGAKKEKYYPTLYLSDSELPDIADLRGGQRVGLVFDAVVETLNASEDSEKKRRTNVTFKLTHGTVKPANLPKDTMDAYLQIMGENDA